MKYVYQRISSLAINVYTIAYMISITHPRAAPVLVDRLKRKMDVITTKSKPAMMLTIHLSPDVYGVSDILYIHKKNDTG